jgi:hypothetical protein
LLTYYVIHAIYFLTLNISTNNTHRVKYNKPRNTKHTSCKVPTATCFGTKVASSGSFVTANVTSPTSSLLQVLVALKFIISKYNKLLNSSNLEFRNFQNLNFKFIFCYDTTPMFLFQGQTTNITAN